jgi:hypothetical protein
VCNREFLFLIRWNVINFCGEGDKVSYTRVEIKKADSTFPYFPLEMRCFPFSTKKLAHDLTVTVVLVNNSYIEVQYESTVPCAACFGHIRDVKCQEHPEIGKREEEIDNNTTAQVLFCRFG